MKRIIFLILLVASTGKAQSAPSSTAPDWISESVREAWTIPPPNQDPVNSPAVSPGQGTVKRPIQVRHRKTLDRKFWAVTAMVIGSSIYDIESSHPRCLQAGTCKERNLLLGSGRGRQYGIKMSFSAAMLLLTYKLKKEGDSLEESQEREGWEEKGGTGWWWPAALPSAIFTTVGTYNMIRFRDAKPNTNSQSQRNP